jgi:hypothetical protein
MCPGKAVGLGKSGLFWLFNLVDQSALLRRALMALKLKREHLERIVVEELTRYIAEQLNEAPPGRGTVLDDEPQEEVPAPEAAPEEQMPVDSPAPEADGEVPLPDAAGGEEGDGELPTGDEPADDDLEADVAGDEESGAEPGTVAYELEDKTIESVSMEEDSKIMPGATEIVLSFRETPDALRLLVTKTGKIKIFYKGLHNDFGSAVEQIPGEEDQDNLGDEELPGGQEDMGGEEMEDMPPLGDEDMPPPPEEEEPQGV